MWGSGKTTVVNLLRKSLEHRARDYAIITFDAWAHQGDPLRRTFLESVVEQLKEKQESAGEGAGWINPKEWKRRLDEIAQRRLFEEHKNIPTLGRWDKAVILSLVFVPLGNALLSAALREEVTIRLGMPAWKFVLGLLLIMAPLVVILWRYLWGGDWSGSNLWTLLSSKGVSESRTETLKTPEPTSIEFEKGFRDLTGQALKNPARKIILVIDNLDRVDSEDALTIWSTLQTFLQHKPNTRYEWLNRLWTVVLYDPRGLRRCGLRRRSRAAVPPACAGRSLIKPFRPASRCRSRCSRSGGISWSRSFKAPSRRTGKTGTRCPVSAPCIPSRGDRRRAS